MFNYKVLQLRKILLIMIFRSERIRNKFIKNDSNSTYLKKHSDKTNKQIWLNDLNEIVGDKKRWRRRYGSN